MNNLASVREGVGAASGDAGGAKEGAQSWAPERLGDRKKLQVVGHTWMERRGRVYVDQKEGALRVAGEWQCSGPTVDPGRGQRWPGSAVGLAMAGHPWIHGWPAYHFSTSTDGPGHP